MNPKKTLSYLRQQPRHVRQQITWVASAALSVLIFAVWWSVFTNDPAQEKRAIADRQGKETSPLSALGNTLAAQKKSVVDLFRSSEYSVKKIIDEPEAAQNSVVDGSTVYPEDIFTNTPTPVTKSAAPTDSESNKAPDETTTEVPPIPTMPEIDMSGM